MKNTYEEMMRIVLLLCCYLILSSCSPSDDDVDPRVRDIYDMSESHTLESWESDSKSSVYWTAFIANAIPAVHLVGVWVDTLVVLSESKQLALGNGSIISRKYQCPGLVSADDYLIIKGLWVGAVSQPRLKQAMSEAKQVMANSKSTQKITQRLAARQLTGLLQKKIGLKVGSKVFFKYLVKIISKKALGFAPVLGGIAAVLINKFFFMDPIDTVSEQYYELKAAVIC